MAAMLECEQKHQWSPVGGSGRVACPECGGPPTLGSLGAPPEVVQWVTKLVSELPKLLGDTFGLVLYGGLARGRFRPGQSDVNVLLALEDPSVERLAKIGPLLRDAWRAVRLERLIVAPRELAQVAAAFPTKLLDIQEHHILLAGSDPLGGLRVAPELIRRRIEQSLANMMLRLRRRFVAAYDSPADLRVTLSEIARPLALELAALLRLEGRAVPDEDRTSAIFAAAATAWNLSAQDLARLAELRVTAGAHEVTPDFFGRVLAIMAQAASRLGSSESQA